jgi:cytochrome c-type biogenesis protein CcmE
MINYKQKRIIFIAIITTISLCGLMLVINNFQDSLVFFYKPEEIFNELENANKINNKINNKILGKNIRVGGLVKEKSLKRIDALTVEFVITDYKKDLIIEHIGVVPDLFRDNQGVVAKGIYDPEKNKFFSRELLIKHDEKYVPYEIKNIKPPIVNNL